MRGVSTIFLHPRRRILPQPRGQPLQPRPTRFPRCRTMRHAIDRRGGSVAPESGQAARRQTQRTHKGKQRYHGDHHAPATMPAAMHRRA